MIAGIAKSKELGEAALRHWRVVLVAGLVCTNLFTYYKWQHNRELYTDEVAAHEQTIKTFTDAQAEANRRAQEVKTQLEEEAAQNAKEADERYDALYSQYRANLVRYQANQRDPGRTEYNRAPTPQGSDRPDPNPIILRVPASIPDNLILITIEDADVCAVNTARLIAAQEWALNPPTLP